MQAHLYLPTNGTKWEDIILSYFIKDMERGKCAGFPLNYVFYCYCILKINIYETKIKLVKQHNYCCYSNLWASV